MRLQLVALSAAISSIALLCSGPAVAAPRTYVVVIDKMKFGPVPTDLHKGDAIVWVNRDFLRHSATAGDGSFDADLPAGAKKRTVLTKSGAIPFACRYHPGMHGSLQVR
ncbi:MAG TPA: cupredoxin domain-containing protein [Sphingomicrobium sp.]|nr:cupredoxin domain-containing protein [Sphingomicrobium sp.]